VDFPRESATSCITSPDISSATETAAGRGLRPEFLGQSVMLRSSGTLEYRLVQER